MTFNDLNSFLYCKLSSLKWTIWKSQSSQDSGTKWLIMRKWQESDDEEANNRPIHVRPNQCFTHRQIFAWKNNLIINHAVLVNFQPLVLVIYWSMTHSQNWNCTAIPDVEHWSDVSLDCDKVSIFLRTRSTVTYISLLQQFSTRWLG